MTLEASVVMIAIRAWSVSIIRFILIKFDLIIYLLMVSFDSTALCVISKKNKKCLLFQQLDLNFIIFISRFSKDQDEQYVCIVILSVFIIVNYLLIIRYLLFLDVCLIRSVSCVRKIIALELFIFTIILQAYFIIFICFILRFSKCQDEQYLYYNVAVLLSITC